MKSQKQLTIQIVNTANNILNFIKSEQYKNQIWNNDISSQNSPYKVWDYTLWESINNLKRICNIIIEREELIDSMSYDMRNNINSYLQNLYSWLSSNFIWNRSNIINYTITIQQWLGNFWISIFSENSKEIDKKLKNINIKNDEITEIRNLSNELKDLKEASNVLENAKNAIEFAKTQVSLKDVNEYINSTKIEIWDLEKQAKDLLWDSSHYALIKHFNDVSIQYKEKAYWEKFYAFEDKDNFLDKSFKFLKNIYIFLFSWTIKYLFYSIILLALNIIIVFYFKENLQIILNNEIIALIWNWLIRLTCISPSLILLSFVFSEYKRLNSLREKYEFKSAIASTFEWHIVTLDKYLDTEKEIDNKVRNDFIWNTVLEIFSNPLNWELQKINNEKSNLKLEDIKSFLENAKENVNLLEKIKELTKW